MRNAEELPAFVPEGALEQAVYQGDFEAALASLEAMPAAGRKACGESLEKMGQIMRSSHWQGSPYARQWGGEAQAAQYRALQAAVVVCMEPKALLDHASLRVALDQETVLALCKRFGIDAAGWRAALQQAAEAGLRAFAAHIMPVQNLVAAGLIDRPQGDEYAIGLMALPRALSRLTTMDQHFERDPGLYQAVLRLFDVEGTGEHNLSAVDKYNHSPKNSWSYIFMDGVARGEFTRAQLLEKTLGTLEKDWPQFRAGWFSRFHDTLAPDAEEMAPFAARYLGLCQSRIPPTVALALGALKTLQAAGHVDGASLLPALRPAFHASAKSQVEAALKLAEAAVKREPSLAHEASAVVLCGLVHEAADLQKKIIERLKGWGVDDAARNELAAYVDSVAAVNRPALAALLGDASALAMVPVVVEQTPAEATGDGPTDPLDASRALVPITEPAELVERIAFVLENSNDIDELERVVEALVRMAPLPEALVKQCAPVVKRARKLLRSEVPARLARLLVFVTSGERLPDLRDDPRRLGLQKPQADEFLALRIDDLVNQAAKGWCLAPLSSATHARGFIDAAVFVERVAAYQARSAEPSLGEQVRGLLRLAPVQGQGAAVLREKARRLADVPLVRALRHALGEDGIVIPAKADQAQEALFAAAARIRHPGGDDSRVLAALGDVGPNGASAARCTWSVSSRSSTYDGKTYVHHDFLLASVAVHQDTPHALVAVRRAGIEGDYDEALLRYAATVLPSSLESFFAAGCREIGNNLDWWEAQWQNRAYLVPLLDPTVPVTASQPMAVLLQALALAGKEPGQTALAVDALVHAFTEARLDVPALGAQMRALLASSLAMAKRYGKSLQSAVRADARLAAPVFDLLCEMLAADAENPPKDLAALMELLLEIALSSQRALPPTTLGLLKELKLGGKGRAVQKNLLALGPASPA
ncbi:hypothetical protein EJP69_02350 [Variovorax gossypii]|uniref:Uncharacterized protein n=1 Tax=Variovorax gossypii TaxID=1679495 RepID=A0A431TRC3_9BURK|nr:DUF6493 family protein [Variovorax gossypii]RTQ36606.1 hypothetical protein EJP69_02350 [Variovorax gossypii]